MVMGGAGFAELGLDGKTVLRCVPLTCSKPIEHFNHLSITASQPERPCFEVLPVAAEHHRVVLQRLDSIRRDGNRHL